ncbi:hypothetical protein OSB04_014048 [Centaurea solstitialis]|uniref:Translin n=1 Tax=Centaurea solstitialis TaxID=347529 RepID=A0AA38TG67_9ASTR|nr:hypothetical protein OSB04_014048 [Centaurea solstitialis]
MMKSVFRTLLLSTTTLCHRSLNPNPLTYLSLPTATAAVARRTFHCGSSYSSTMAGGDSSPTVAAVEKQFDEFRHRLEESGSLRDRIKAVATEIESNTRMMHSSLLLVHQSRPIPGFDLGRNMWLAAIVSFLKALSITDKLADKVLEKAKAQIDVLKQLFSSLAEIVRESPGQYYRYHGDWRTETQQVVSLLAFMHWLETGSLLIHTEVEEKLGLNASEFGLDVEDYLIGICFMSNELVRISPNLIQVNCELHASFRLLNLRNDFLRKKFDGKLSLHALMCLQSEVPSCGHAYNDIYANLFPSFQKKISRMKYDLRRVEEVYYDVKIRGLASNKGESKGDQTIEES